MCSLLNAVSIAIQIALLPLPRIDHTVAQGIPAVRITARTAHAMVSEAKIPVWVTYGRFTMALNCTCIIDSLPVTARLRRGKAQRKQAVFCTPKMLVTVNVAKNLYGGTTDSEMASNILGTA